MLRQDGHALITIESKLLWCETSEQVLLSFACWLRSGPRTQRMSLTRCCSSPSWKGRLVWAVTRLIYSPFDPAVETTESIVAGCCHNHAEIKADVDARVLSHAERGIRCLGIASSDTDGKWFSVSISRFQIRFILTHWMSSPEPVIFASR